MSENIYFPFIFEGCFDRRYSSKSVVISLQPFGETHLLDHIILVEKPPASPNIALLKVMCLLSLAAQKTFLLSLVVSPFSMMYLVWFGGIHQAPWILAWCLSSDLETPRKLLFQIVFLPDSPPVSSPGTPIMCMLDLFTHPWIPYHSLFCHSVLYYKYFPNIYFPVNTFSIQPSLHCSQPQWFFRSVFSICFFFVYSSFGLKFFALSSSFLNILLTIMLMSTSGHSYIWIASGSSILSVSSPRPLLPVASSLGIFFF